MGRHAGDLVKPTMTMEKKKLVKYKLSGREDAAACLNNKVSYSKYIARQYSFRSSGTSTYSQKEHSHTNIWIHDQWDPASWDRPDVADS